MMRNLLAAVSNDHKKITILWLLYLNYSYFYKIYILSYVIP